MSADLPINSERGLGFKTSAFMKLIKIEHTLFAMPYAIAAAFLAAGGLPSWRVMGLIVLAMIGARTAAMAFNRLVDRDFDRDNPRTAKRASATGAIGTSFMIAAILLSSLLFLAAAWYLNTLAFYLAAPTLLVLLSYSLMKRIWHQSHLVLGLALGLSPLGAWVAVRGSLGVESLPALFLALAVLFWTNGFDILYACQDFQFDRDAGLKSVPARFGIAKALTISRISHVLVPIFLFLAGYYASLGWGYQAALIVVIGLLIYEHRLVSDDNLDQVNRAFFSVNITIGFVVMLAIMLEIFWLQPGGLTS